MHHEPSEHAGRRAERRLLRLLIHCCRDCRRSGQEFDRDTEESFRRCVDQVRRRLRARGFPVA